MVKKKSLGESLVEEGLITKEQLKQVQEAEKRTGTRLRKLLVSMGMVDEESLVVFLSNQLKVPRIELVNYLIDPKIIELVPENLARKYELIPVFKIGNRLTCAMMDPLNVFAMDELGMQTNFLIEPVVATESEIKKAIEEYYSAKGSIDDVIKSIGEEKAQLSEEEESQQLETIAQEPGIVKLVNLVTNQAIKDGASDIHIEPEKEVLKIRFRIDGLLQEVSSPPKHLQSALVSRIKILANLDIAERRAPQDGRFSVRIEGREIDVRVSCMPTIYGENVVLRLLDVSSAILNLDQLGFSKEVLEDYRKLITYPHGIILVTGPTGSGKTSTLYSSLKTINTMEKNIVTIEDPVEYRLSGITQTQVNPKINLTFANGLRSILRQDPDVIMVGEIRDKETAEIAIQAALTGHLVFSTLHTNDASGAVTRLIEMGIEPFLVSSSLVGVMAQRLVRTICKDCKKEEYTPALDVFGDINLQEKIKLYRGKGCPKCMNRGYRGRIAIFELMILDEALRHLILKRTPHGEIKKQARVLGMRTLREDGVEKIKQGLTTVEEVLRVTREA